MIEDQDQRSVLRLTLGLGGFIVILVGMYYMSGLVNQVLLAAFLTLLMVPVSQRLQKRGMSSKWANLLIILFVLVVLLLLILFLIYSLAGLVTDLPIYEQGLDETKVQIQTQLESMGVDGESVATALTSVSKRILGIGASIATGLVGYLVSTFFVILMFAFMLFDAVGVRTRMQRAFSSDNPTLSRVHNSTSSVVTYLRLLTYINLVIGVSDTLLLWILGIPNPALWGLLAFITGYIPFIGFWIAMIPVLIIAYLQGGIMLALIVFLGYWLINGTLSNIVAPRIYGKGLNLSPVITLIAVLFWGVILGPLGGMLAVPLTAILNSVVLISYPETRWLAILMREGDGSE
jgi:AI-2 transport protein TqsA